MDSRLLQEEEPHLEQDGAEVGGLLNTPLLIRIDDNPILKKLLGDPTKLSNPIQEIVAPLRKELSVFIRDSQKPIPTMGIRGTPGVALDVDELEEKLTASSMLLEELIHEDTYGIPGYISYRSLANALQTGIDDFASLVRGKRSEKGIPLSCATEVSRAALQLRYELGSLMIQAEAVSLGISLNGEE